jgi:hypothetical protein
MSFCSTDQEQPPVKYKELNCTEPSSLSVSVPWAMVVLKEGEV